MPPPIPTPRSLPAVVLSRDIGYDAARSAHRAGVLTRVRDGAYLHGELPAETWARREVLALARCVAVSRQLPGRAVLSHESAALVHGAWVRSPTDRTHLSVPWRPHKPDVPDISRHYSPDLSEEDITTVGGLRVTTLERTALDCALTFPPRRALPLVDSVLRILSRPNRFSREQSDSAMATVRDTLRAKLDDLGRRPGVVSAREVIGYADGFSESPGESDLRWIAVSRGLPRPVAQFLVRTAEGDFYTDMGWDIEREGFGAGEARCVVAEFDGTGKYAGSPRALFTEKLREDAIRATRAVMHRYADRHLTDADAAFARLCRGFPRRILDSLRPVAALMQLPTRR
ncbi:Transcriptional regulator, AbiEi antitoxin, Type IV TA system [Georgenia soli]|uniref:Transcriptional regulator, AbiEi antitoxin, Type IV TA system n=1 Tax=Georgenia soli TaxID=638953 RepID=A0A2A9EJX5_9MICO|nr:hypothetical protein [Georgenia soli]PFG39113.1 Transcriptional regulator, AbiEi antitoxin, Type IV TA system [Georgenia soli]